MRLDQLIVLVIALVMAPAAPSMKDRIWTCLVLLAVAAIFEALHHLKR